MNLEGKSVLIIGGSSGLGLATAQLAKRQGAQVIIASRSTEKLNSAADAIGSETRVKTVDVTQDASVADLMESVGTVDHIVFTAPGATVGNIKDLEIAAIQDGFNAKFWGAVRTAKYAQISKDGSLTVISGQMARRPRPGLLAGSCVNAALDALARGLAVEIAPVRVNAISPGIIDTPLHARLSDEARAKTFEAARSRLPVGRVGRAEEIASMILEVMNNGFLTGTIIEIDGGANALL